MRAVGVDAVTRRWTARRPLRSAAKISDRWETGLTRW